MKQCDEKKNYLDMNIKNAKKKHKCNDDDKMCSNEISGDKIFFFFKKKVVLPSHVYYVPKKPINNDFHHI